VTLPPGRARLLTYPLPTGSLANENTIGTIDVACINAGTAPPPVTMTLTFNAMNSAAISAKRSLRPSALTGRAGIVYVARRSFDFVTVFLEGLQPLRLEGCLEYIDQSFGG
jgi:hypothetical protein